MGQRYSPIFCTPVLLTSLVERLKCVWGTSMPSVPLLQEKRVLFSCPFPGSSAVALHSLMGSHQAPLWQAEREVTDDI